MRKAIEFTEEQIQKAKELAAQGISVSKAADEMGVCFSTMKKLAIKYGIIYEDGTHKPTIQKYTLDKHHFDVIDTPNKAYFLGFMFADAAVEKDLTRIKVRLQEQDLCLLEEMKREFNCNAPIKELVTNKKTLGDKVYYGEYKAVQLILAGKELVTRGTELGLIPTKSLVVEFPKEVPNKLMPDFIRGYYDGNGHLVHSLSTKYTNRLGITTGSEGFVKQIYDYCKNQFSIQGRILKPKNKNCYVWEVTSIDKIITFCQHIYYEGCRYSLPRKYNKYVEFCKYAISANIPNRPIIDIEKITQVNNS